MSKKNMTVDGSPSIPMLLRVALGRLGVEVSDAEEGVEAKERMESEHRELGVTDLAVPRLAWIVTPSHPHVVASAIAQVSQ